MDLAVLKVFGFAVVLARVTAFLLVIPIFSSSSIPLRIRLSLTLLISFFLSVSMPTMVVIQELSVLTTVLLIINEVVYGVALGFIVMFIFSIVKLSFRIIERQMGFAFAGNLDPISGETAESLSIMMEMLFILLFLAANGHHMLLLIIAKSYEALPAGQIPDISLLVEAVVKAGSTMLITSLRLSAPILAAFLLLLVILGVFARIMPDMNILFISMPLRVGLGLLMVGVLIPFINQFVGEFADWMGKLLPI